MNAKWSKIVDNLQKMLESGIFRIWVAPLKGDVDNSGVHIFAPNPFMADWVKRHLMPRVKEAASPVLNIAPESVSIDVSLLDGQKNEKPMSSADVIAKLMADTPTPQRCELPLKYAPMESSGQWRYSFDDFVTGSSNKLAVAAAQDMCTVGQVRTLFINSASGLGKTHLAQAVGQAISKSGKPLKVAYLTGEQFASRFVAAMKARELEEFKQYLCSRDVLLLEDIHFLQRKKTMQEMVLGVIKNLQDKGSRVIFTSSFAPRQLEDMDSHLVSHFCSGIMANMEKPDISMRKEILERKSRIFQVSLPEEVSDLLCQKLSSDVRQLESCLKNMIFKARLMHSGINLDLAMETLGQYTDVDITPDLQSIVRLVCESFGLNEMQLKSRSRKQQLVQGRNTVFYLARKHTEMSLEEIGCIFNRKHSTVLRSITQVERELAMDSTSGRQIARAVSLIERKFGIDN